ncbi:MAG: hypothetical protein LBU32_01540 [Clostridiales bacterium]|jgi:hypothetical protein|nr:hypothetical protein [Clostridiales bacterium]
MKYSKDESMAEEGGRQLRIKSAAKKIKSLIGVKIKSAAANRSDMASEGKKRVFPKIN